jgi:hypothetical protein
MAMVHRLRGEPGPLLEAIERVVAIAPDHEEALEWAAWSYLSIGRPADAVGILERLVERHPQSLEPAMWLSATYEMLGRTDDEARAEGLLHERIPETCAVTPTTCTLRCSPDPVRSGNARRG